MAGRPTKYQEEYAKKAYKLALLGATDKELADFFEIVESTLYEWKKDFPEFSEAISRGKVNADANVSGRLYKLALGFHYTESSEGHNDNGSFIQKGRRYNTPDFRAIRFWLMNRQPDKWREKQVVQHEESTERPEWLKKGEIPKPDGVE